MEQSPSGINFSAEKFSDDKDKKKKGKSKRFGFVAPVVENPEPKPEKKPQTDQSETDKLLAGLVFSREKEQKRKKAEEAADVDKKRTAESTAAETEKPDDSKVEAVTEEAARQKLSEAFNTDYQQEIKANELPPSKIFSEGIVDLHHEDEQIVALREEQKKTEPNESVVWRSQPEQQHQARQEDSGETEPAEPSQPEEAVASQTEPQPLAGPEAQATSVYSEYAPTDVNNQHETEPPAPVPPAASVAANSIPFFGTPNQAPTASGSKNPNTLSSAPSPANIAPQVAPNIPPNSALFGASIPGAANYNQAPVQNLHSANKNMDKNKYVTKEEYEDGIYHATKYGQRRGVLAGLTVAGYEHFKHRRRERKLKKELQAQEKTANKTQKQQYFEAAEQKKLLNQKERQLAEMQAAAARQPEAKPVAPVTAVNERQPTTAEQTPTIRQENKPESHFRTQLEKLVPKRPERPKAGEIEPAEKLEVPAEHHLETSAWHTIEVDTKTGRAVETPTFAYGEEYYRERAKETRSRTDDQKQAAGEVAMVAAAVSDSDSGANTRSDYVPPTDANTHQRTSTRSLIAAKAKNAFQASKSAAGGQQDSGPLWPWLLAFGVIVVLLIIVL